MQQSLQEAWLETKSLVQGVPGRKDLEKAETEEGFSRFLTHHRSPPEAAASKVLKQLATYTVHLRKLFLDWSHRENLLGKFTNSESQAVS